MSSVAVIGSGYVGLTTAVCLAHHGHDVIGVDIDEDRVNLLNKGQIPIFEEGLQELVEQGLNSGKLKFSSQGQDAVSVCEFVFLCLPTPQNEDGSADLSYVQSAVKELAQYLNEDAVVLNKSTVPVGSVRKVSQMLIENGSPESVTVVSNPEFLREGVALYDALNPTRIVIGSDSEEVNSRVKDLYEAFEAPVVLTDPESAEMIKYASNAFLACKISFINEMSRVADAFNADIKEVARGMGYDPRIGSQFLQPGPGYGGSCFPKDTSALLHAAKQRDVDVPVIHATIASNEQQFDHVLEIVSKLCSKSGKTIDESKIAVWGLAFKAGTDDVRESPACEVVRRLCNLGAQVHSFDPQANKNARKILKEAVVEDDLYAVVQGADLLIVLTEWDDFKQADFKKVRSQMNSPIVFDTRNILDADALGEIGISVHGIGRHQI